MQKYFDTIKSKKSFDLDLMLAEKKIDLERNKFYYNLFMICYISFFILVMPQHVFSKWFEGYWAISSYVVVVLIGIIFGMVLYHIVLESVVAEYEVLNYLKNKNFKILR